MRRYLLAVDQLESDWIGCRSGPMLTRKLEAIFALT